MEQPEPHYKYSETEQEETAPSGHCIATFWGRKKSLREACPYTFFTSFITHKHLSFETCSRWPDPACSVRSLFLLCLEDQGVRKSRGRGTVQFCFSQSRMYSDLESAWTWSAEGTTNVTWLIYLQPLYRLLEERCSPVIRITAAPVSRTQLNIDKSVLNIYARQKSLLCLQLDIPLFFLGLVKKVYSTHHLSFIILC